MDVELFNKYNSTQVRFMIWLATPRNKRQPKTQRKLALELGVNEDTLTNWKGLPGFAESAVGLSKRFMLERIPELVGVIADEAINNKSAHCIDRMLEITGTWNKKQVHEHKFILEDALNALDDGEDN